MADFKKRYLMITTDIMPDGFSFQCWMAVEPPHPIDALQYPNRYTYMGDTCTWLMYSSSELTPKIIRMAGEQADRLCASGIARANSRKPANR